MKILYNFHTYSIICYSSYYCGARTTTCHAAAFVPTTTSFLSCTQKQPPKQNRNTQQQRRFLNIGHSAKPYSSSPAFLSQKETITTSLKMTTTNANENEGNDDANDKDDDCDCIYLDYNGTTPIDKRVLDAMMPFFTNQFGNPSSSHYYGKAPKEAIKKARSSILSLLYAKSEVAPDQEQEQERHNGIIFTGCGTEADNLAIHLALQSVVDRNGSNEGTRIPRIITSNVEHPAITEYLKSLEEQGMISVTYVPVNNEGIVSVQNMIDAIDGDHDDNTAAPVALVTLMLANNESGSLQPVKEVAQYCRTKSILFHTDAAQAVGKVSIALDDNNSTNASAEGIGDGVDMITLVGHKFGAPKGIACLYVKPNCFQSKKKHEPQNYMLLGGGQENGKRSGTENVPYIVGMGKAADILMTKTTTTTTNSDTLYQWQQNAKKMNSMRELLLTNIKRGVVGDESVDNNDNIIRDNGPAKAMDRLPNTLSIGFKLPIQSSVLLNQIQSRVACSAGSACHASGGPSISPVLKAMNVPMEYATGTLRLSVGPTTTKEEINRASQIIIDEVKRQQQHTLV